MLSNNAYTQEYFDIMESLGGDIESRRAAYDYMKNSTAIVHHQVISTSFVPRLYDRRTREIMRTTVETTHRILCKVIEHYLEDPDYRTIFDYDPRLAELILVPRGYDAVLPFARFDIFLDEETEEVAFCEFNGDGSSGMNENREIDQLAREREDLPGVRAPSQSRALRALRCLGGGLHQHLPYLQGTRRASPLRHLRLPAKWRRRRVPPVRKEVRGTRLPVLRMRRARPHLRRRGAPRRAGPTRACHLAPLRHQRRARVLGRLAGAHQGRTRAESGAHRQLRRAHRARQTDLRGTFPPEDAGTPHRRGERIRRAHHPQDALPRLKRDRP